jgi:hypothetical protein
MLEHRQTRDARRVASSPDGRARFGALPETLRALLTFAALRFALSLFRSNVCVCLCGLDRGSTDQVNARARTIRERDANQNQDWSFAQHHTCVPSDFAPAYRHDSGTFATGGVPHNDASHPAAEQNSATPGT